MESPAGRCVLWIREFRAFGLLSAWISRRRQRRALAALDDRLLRDLGLTREDAARECRKPFWRR
ncbi:MAG TPA: DUF1127 domain-containing protein [Azospirillum sp.]